MERKHKILIVDDTEMNRSLLADMLAADYEILEASNGLEAISVLERYASKISLVLLDIVMPRMDGFEVMATMNKNEQINSIPVIMISAETSSSYIDQAYDLGATDYISRPFDEKIVRRRVKNTIMLYAKQKMLQGMVSEQIIEKEKNNFLMVEILSNIVEFRNGESGLHVLHIRTITELLLKETMKRDNPYGLTLSKIALIVNASALHDIGKISIAEKILNKPGKLTPDEFEIMKNHTIIGAEILKNAPHKKQEELVQVAHDICRWHHERYDGNGYPDGLKGDEIPISAQIVSLADVYDALISPRVYKAAYSHDTAMKMILSGECGAFHPLLLECLQAVNIHLSEEVKVRSLTGMTQPETQRITSELMARGDLYASDRTLSLLEQERTKYQFFASMSREVQFEYNLTTDMLTLSEWGAKHLGVNELILHPIESEEVLSIFSRKDLDNLRLLLGKTTPSSPLVSATYCLNLQGQPRWFRTVARTLWDDEELPHYTGAIGKFIDIHEQQTELDTFKQLATRDSLTKLYNHLTAQNMIETALSGGGDHKYALILFDLDYFKYANDTYGHLFGDHVLKYVAQRILSNIRSEDISARVGGDEFMIFTEFKGDIQNQVNRIFNSLTDIYKGFKISISMGIAIYPNNARDYQQLFHCADQALYASKKDGRNQYRFYDTSIHGFLSVLSPMDNES
ncbi:diguanylate cyclase [Ruminococcus sp. OA3]|uniref:bifunctional diguanylate cyclase/phosphohydrolase n=1 Tax=Ruminococcus sp. OA3 TaxID=2914164 RepID=UPI001F05F6F2|nr:diguanylate cyclase [Ruminococcus sp. OA3]MCH1984416.1 diguanylate cyclase [Ruminococcus sp. OA3]